MPLRKRGEGREFSQIRDIPPVPLNEADAELFGAISALDAAMPQVERAIVARRGGVIEIGCFKVSAVGLEIDDRASEEEWLAFIEAVKRIHKSLQWIVGDWIAYGETFLGKTYEEMAQMTGLYNAGTLRQLAYVCRNTPMSIRIDTLSFAHHQAVMGLEQPARIEWLRHAADHHWGVARLREELQGRPTLPDKDPYGAGRFSKSARKVGALITRIGQGSEVSQKARREALGYVQQMRAYLDYVEQTINDNLKEEGSR